MLSPSIASLAIILASLLGTECLEEPSLRDLPGYGRLMASRATAQHTVELYIIADYSLYKEWYDRTTGISDTTEHQKTTITNLKKYLGSLINTADMAYRSLEKYGIYVKLVLTEIQVITTAEQSHWTENIKFMNGSKYQVNGFRAVDELAKTSASILVSNPHDHLMLVTAYDLVGQGNEDILGVTHPAGICTNLRVSVVEDSKHIQTAQTMAHELGHSLGAQHDGEGNNCTTATDFLMAPALDRSHILREWIFSICSSGHIMSTIQKLNRENNNCMTVINNLHPDQQVAEYTKLFFGDLYSADDQCRMIYGPGSHVCRHAYINSTNPYNGLCQRFVCYDPKRNDCYTKIAGDHTLCGNHKWCVLGQCLPDPHAGAAIEDCLYGDVPGIVYKGQTCADYISDQPSFYCTEAFYRSQCCRSCAKLATNISGCPYGDTASSSICASTVPNMCYSRRYALQCCKTCHDLETADPGCRWGDKANFCNVLKSYECYSQADTCCLICNTTYKTDIPGCMYGDKINTCDHSMCPTYEYYQQLLCCNTCRDFAPLIEG